MDPRRRIPPVEALLASPAFAGLLTRVSRGRVVTAIRAVQNALRDNLAGGGAVPDGVEAAWYAERVETWLAEQDRPSLRPVINATGVVLHTNLGRAPLADVAREAMATVASSYSNLEYDMGAGERGSRYDHCIALLGELTGAEAALVVNNNAAAVVLSLNTLARGREAVISRGELVEIGGSFRVPEIMAKSGAVMREVGATNRTHVRDYEAVVGEGTGAILKVHRSNFQVTGFTAEASIPELVALGRRHGVPVICDLGSGLLLDLAPLGLSGEPTVAEVMDAGPDVVTLSGDKLLGGPQAGILLGAAAHIDAMRANPLCRALRPDKLTLAALEATLALYREPERALKEIPALRMLALPVQVIEARARALQQRLHDAGVASDVAQGTSAVGGGAFPGAGLPTMLLRLTPDERSDHETLAALRAGEPPVVARAEDGRVVLDLRTVAPEDDDALFQALHRVPG